jgi:hypothetical protein
MRNDHTTIWRTVLVGAMVGCMFTGAPPVAAQSNRAAYGNEAVNTTTLSVDNPALFATADETDAISREVSVFRPWQPPMITDAISREVSVYRDMPCEPPACYMDAISREISVFKPWPVPQVTDAVSREVSTFSVIPLTLGTPYEGNWPVRSVLFFRVTTPPGETVRITLHHDSPTAMTELLASFGSTPNSLTAQFVGEEVGTGTRELVIPTTQAGTYFILARYITDSTVNASRSFDILATTLVFGIDRVEPTTVGAGEEVTIRIRGGRLDSATTIHLQHSSGGPLIAPLKTTILDSSHIRTRFDLRGITFGSYDLIIESFIGEHSVLHEGISIEVPDAIGLDVEVTPSPGLARRHGLIQGTTALVLRNSRNVDAPFAFLDLITPADPNLTLSLDQQTFVKTPYVEKGFFVIESIAPGEEVRVNILMDIQRGFAQPVIPIYMVIRTYSRKVFRDNFLLGHEGYIDYFVSSYCEANNCTAEFYNEIVPKLHLDVSKLFDEYGLQVPDPSRVASQSSDTPPIGLCEALCLMGIAACISTTGQAVACTAAGVLCINCCRDPCLSYCPRDVCACVECPLQCNGPTDCPSSCVCTAVCGEWLGNSCTLRAEFSCERGNCTPYNFSADPNEKVGPEGYSIQGFVQSTPLIYRIYFENLASATAPAAEVVITDSLETLFDSGTFRLREFSFGSKRVKVPAGRPYFKDALDLTDDLGLLVELEGAIDSATNVATFTLRALDPVTRQLPADLLVGFLPPNDESGRGEGYVEFEIAPKANTLTGTPVTNKAEIIFDFNLPIIACAPTEESGPDCVGWFNTIDAGAPISAVEPLALESATPFVVRWSAEDDEGGSGVAVVDIFVQIDDGAFEHWMSSDGDWAWFEGEVGKTYSFYAVGRDFVGNVEDKSATPEAASVVTATRLPGDVNSDAIINCDDHSFLLTCLLDIEGQSTSGPDRVTVSACAEADLNLDQRVDLRDYAIFQNSIKKHCQPK